MSDLFCDRTWHPSSVTGRDEDLECGPLVNGFESILSRDFETGRIDILEAPDGTCVITEVALTPTSAVNDLTSDNQHIVTMTVTANGQPLPGVQISFTITAGPNIGQVSDPGECSVNVNCITDASGQTSWTYTGTGGFGTDTMRACFTTAGGTQHCAEATKDWRDLTPPLVACTPSTNPHGQNKPPAQHQDRFYEVTATDALDPNPDIFVVDSGSGVEFGPFPSGTIIKYTKAPGATPSIKPGPGAVDWHITGTGDMQVYAVDDSGNTSAALSTAGRLSCLDQSATFCCE